MIVVREKPVCLISGGSSGIGLATAKLFFNAGYRVAICGRDAEKLQRASADIAVGQVVDPKLIFSDTVDLVDSQAAKQFADTCLDYFGRIDVLVNNAAVAPLTPFGATTDECFEELVDVNIRSSFYLLHVVWKTMLRQRQGTIVNVSSQAAIDPFPGFSLYGASKAWLELLTHSLAQEGRENGVRVCAVRPGAVDTPMLRGLFPDFPQNECLAPAAVGQLILDCVEQPERFPSGQAFDITVTS